jgi:micrococcal nuclease
MRSLSVHFQIVIPAIFKLILPLVFLAHSATAADGWTNYDGDTLRSPAGERIRVKGIDTPEIKGACAYERRLALEARDYVTAVVRSSRTTEIRRVGIDKYGRTLAYVLVDGKDLGDEMVSRGLARKWEGRRRSWCQ